MERPWYWPGSRSLVLEDTVLGAIEVVPYANVAQILDHYQDFKEMPPIVKMVHKEEQGNNIHVPKIITIPCHLEHQFLNQLSFETVIHLVAKLEEEDNRLDVQRDLAFYRMVTTACCTDDGKKEASILAVKATLLTRTNKVTATTKQLWKQAQTKDCAEAKVTTQPKVSDDKVDSIQSSGAKSNSHPLPTVEAVGAAAIAVMTATATTDWTATTVTIAPRAMVTEIVKTVMTTKISLHHRREE